MCSALPLQRQSLLQQGIKRHPVFAGETYLGARQTLCHSQDCNSEVMSRAHACLFSFWTQSKRSSGCAVAKAQPVAAGH